MSTAITAGSNSNSIYDEVPSLKAKSLEILPTTGDNERENYTTYERMPSRKRSDYDEDDDNEDDGDDCDNHQLRDQTYQCEYHMYHRTVTDDFYHTYDIYASDSVLNTHIDNIYDVPCDDYAAANVSCDSILEQRGDRFSIFNDHDVGDDDDDNDGDHTAQPPKIQVSNFMSSSNYCNRLQMERANEIHDYDLYYRRKLSGKSQNRCSEGSKSGAEVETNTEPCYLSSGTSTLASNTINSTTSASDSLRPSVSSAITTIQSKSSTLSSISVSKVTKASSSSSTTTTSTSVTTFQHRKTPSSILYSPLHYHANSNLSTGNRPNSRNSLNSRLSSSHNSLTISSSNKADDSIFITQAMSHDRLTSREISDFYNVPFDSDIYALPLDVIRPIFSSNTTATQRPGQSNRNGGGGGAAGANGGGSGGGSSANKGAKHTLGDKSMTTMRSVTPINSSDLQKMPPIGSSRTSMLLKSGTKHFRGRLKYVRNNKRRKRQQQQNLDGNGVGAAVGSAGANAIPLKSGRSNSMSSGGDKRYSAPENGVAEPTKHMTLDEVKQMYTSLCSSSSESALELKAITKNMSASNFNAADFNHSSGRINKLALSSAASCVFGTFSSNKNTNNNNNLTSFNHNNANGSIVILKSDRNFNLSHVNNNNNLNNNNNTINASNSIANSHTKSSIASSAAISTLSSVGTAANYASSTTANSSATTKLPNSKTTTAKHPMCSIKKISSSPSIVAKEMSNDSLASINATSTRSTQSTKKSQFSISLNLKQKFCSIFRFRKSYSTHAAANNGSGNRDMADYGVAATADKKVKFSTRALPPLPSKLKGNTAN